MSLSGLDPAIIMLALLIMLLAYTVKGMAGFGSGLIAVPLLALFLPLTMVVPMLGLISYSGTVIQSYQLRRQVNWHDCLIVLPFSIAGVLLALWLFHSIELIWLNRSLALFVIGYALISLIPRKPKVRDRHWAVPAGFLAGLIGTLFGTGGPFYVIYLKLRNLDKTVFRATIAMIFLFDGGIRIIGYSLSGFYQTEVLILAILSFPVLILGLYLGHRMHLSMSDRRFNQLISLLLLISGFFLLIK